MYLILTLVQIAYGSIRIDSYEMESDGEMEIIRSISEMGPKSLLS